MVMRIQFEATIDDLVDLYERTSARSKVARSWVRQGVVWSALLSAFLWGLMVLVVAYCIWKIPELAVGLASVAALMGAVTTCLFYRERIRQRYYAYFREQFGNRDSFLFEAELSEAGIWTRQLGVQRMVEWSNVEEMTLREDAIEFYMYGGYAVVVRSRAFASTDEQQRFIDEARRHLNTSRTSSNWLR